MYIELLKKPTTILNQLLRNAPTSRASAQRGSALAGVRVKKSNYFSYLAFTDRIPASTKVGYIHFTVENTSKFSYRMIEWLQQ